MADWRLMSAWFEQRDEKSDWDDELSSLRRWEEEKESLDHGRGLVPWCFRLCSHNGWLILRAHDVISGTWQLPTTHMEHTSAASQRPMRHQL